MAWESSVKCSEPNSPGKRHKLTVPNLQDVALPPIQKINNPFYRIETKWISEIFRGAAMTQSAFDPYPGDMYICGLAGQIELFDGKEGPAEASVCSHNAALASWTRKGCSRSFASPASTSVRTGRKSNRRFASSSCRSRNLRSQLAGSQTIIPDMRPSRRNRRHGNECRERRALWAKPALPREAGSAGQASGRRDCVRDVRVTLSRWRIKRQVRNCFATSDNP